jgi:manganese/iron transport system permease protein
MRSGAVESFLSYGFLVKALWMGVISGATCGAIGVFVVLWRISFVGVCISHAAFAGALIGLWLGIPPLAGGLAGSLGAASLIGPLADRPTFSPDTAIGVIFSVMLSLAMLALGLLPGAKTEGLGLIWGSLLAVNALDLLLMGGASLLLLIFLCLFFKEIQATLGQRQAAMAAGIPVRGIYYASLTMLGLVVAIALKAIGGLLIYSLIVIPAVAALQLTYSLRIMFVLASLTGAISSVIGLWLSFHLGIPTGAAIVLTAAGLLILTIFVSPKRKTI